MIKRYLISFLIVSVFFSPSVAQWVQVAPNLLGNIPSSCCGFGSIAYKNGIVWAGRTGLWESPDMGKTWTKLSVSFTGVITQIEFFDQNIGVFGTDDGSVQITTDQGKNWKLIHSGGQCYGVSFCGSANNIIAVSDYAGLFYTSNQGTSWNTAPTGGHVLCCIGRKDGSALVHNEGEVRSTTDNGQTWQHTGQVDYDSFSFGIDSTSTDEIYLMNEEGHISTDNKSSVFHSTDGGTNWNDLAQHPGRFYNGSFAVTPDAIYAQTLSNGVYISKDHGATWVSICGPSNNIDSRMLCAINDSNIFAADANGSIWRLTASLGTTSSFSISTKRVDNDTLGVEIFLPIYLKAKGSMPSFDIDVHYPVASLIYLRSILPNGKIIDVQNQQWPGRSKIHFDAADLAALSDSLVGYSVFKRVPDNYDCGHVVFDSALVMTSGTPCSGVVTLTAPATEGIIGAPKMPDVQFSVFSERLINDTLGVTVHLPIYLKSAGVVPSFDFVMHYPPSPLTYVQSVTVSGKSVDVVGQKWTGRAKLHFDAVDIASRKDSLIGFSEFKWFPYEYDCAHIPFDSITATLPQNVCALTGTVKATADGGYIGSFTSCGLPAGTDVNPPQFVVSKSTNNFGDTLKVNDGRSSDEGLKSITWIAEVGTDTTKFIVSAVSPLIKPCYNDKQEHTFNVMQLDSTVAGCYDFIFTDCLGQRSYTKICLPAHAKSSVEDGEKIIASLEANHPNPFSNITTFTYTTADYGMVRLTLFDELGREATRIVEGVQGIGHYSIRFDGSSLSVGNYIARFESGGKVISRRVVVER